MKVLFLGMAKLKYMPYMDFYLNQINLEKDEVHILYWDRDGKSDINLDSRIHLHCFKADIDDSESIFKKLPLFIKYRKYASTIIENIKPDRLIVHYQTTGVLIYDKLRGKYQGKYILDYRDVTYERIYLFKKIVEKLVLNSYATFTSSDGFKKFLPKSEKIYTSHNLVKSSLKKQDSVIDQHIFCEKVRISFWGIIRHTDLNAEIIRKIGKDERFELHYYGRAQGNMKQLLNESVEKHKNVFYHGEYLPNDRHEFAKKTDLIHNIYDNNDKTMPLAMANKFYDGPLFNVPQLCMQGSHMGQLCEKYGIGMACNPYDEDFLDAVYSYYKNIKRNIFQQNVNAFMKSIEKEITDGEKIIKAFFESE